MVAVNLARALDHLAAAGHHWPMSHTLEQERELPSTVVRIHPDQVYFLRFVLEAHDHAFVLTTLDRNTGLVKIAYAPGTDRLLDSILSSLCGRIGLLC